MRETWLNGWARDGDHVSIGSGLHCAGCGRDLGVVCIAVGPDTAPPPSREPDWPFEEDGCPVCLLRSQQPRDELATMAGRYARMAEARRVRAGS